MRNNKLSAICRRKVQLICILCLFPVFLTAQSKPFDAKPQKGKSPVESTGKKDIQKASAKTKKINAASGSLMAVPTITPVKKKNTIPGKKIYLESCETVSYDAFISSEYQVLSGNVRFRHEGALMFCDSAYFYEKSNSLFAFGNVHLEQGDTVFLYGARLYYDGNTKLAMVREKVRLENRKVTLFTDSLNYDRASNIGYFFDGGLLVNEDGNVTNELSSEYGQYSPDTKIADFKHDVMLKHPQFVLTNQELIYNTKTGEADIDCPTHIVADSGFIYTEKGWYNTKTDKSLLLNRSYILNNHRRLTGDSIHYDKKNGIGEAFGEVVLIDSTQQVTFKGDYAYNDEKTNYALLSKNALMIEHSSKDTLYLHADSLISKQDSIYKAVTAYRGVRFYRSDIQGLCDSLYYSSRDSVLSFYYKPILWSEQQQLSGDFMQLFTKNQKPKRLEIIRSAMAISFEADSLYNQMSGKDIVAYLDSGMVYQVDINGNAETVYIPKDEKTRALLGLNCLESSSAILYLKNKELKKMVFWPQPKGSFYPLIQIPSDKRYLGNFVWYSDLRPKNPADVLREAPVPGLNRINVATETIDSKQVSEKPTSSEKSTPSVGKDRIPGKNSLPASKGKSSGKQLKKSKSK